MKKAFTYFLLFLFCISGCSDKITESGLYSSLVVTVSASSFELSQPIKYTISNNTVSSFYCSSCNGKIIAQTEKHDSSGWSPSDVWPCLHLYPIRIIQVNSDTRIIDSTGVYNPGVYRISLKYSSENTTNLDKITYSNEFIVH